VGAFTEQGTFTAAAARLAELADLGVTAVELLPIADFPGTRNWGYDEVLLFAPDAAYGTPDELKGFIDHAHSLGLMVLLDVVYNHFGPDGNYLHAYCPEFFTERHHTPWGAAINFDGEASAAVREFFLENALYWIEEFHFDGLRLDAVDQIRDDSPKHIICDIAQALRDGPGRTRQVHLVVENDKNQTWPLERGEDRTPTCATAQWNDDFHHAVHVALTAEAGGYYQDYLDEPVGLLARALGHGFSYQGQHSAYRNAPHGAFSGHLPSSAFVSFIQNHDQIGNRAFGERINAVADGGRLDAAYACLLLSPHIPMLYMGEEFAASTPFLFFCDFQGDLARAVSEGRRAGFARFAAFESKAARDDIPDPNALSTFLASKLQWSEREASPHRERLALMRKLLSLRARYLTPHLGGQRSGGAYRSYGGLLRVEWVLGDGLEWHMLANFGDKHVSTGAAPDGTTIFQSGVNASTGAPGENGSLDLAPGAVLVVKAG
jgi:maltooligosyltrehalose trehalohydrolase